MDKILIKGNLILWISDNKKWLINYDELTIAYIKNVLPYTGQKLSTIVRNKLLIIIQKIAGGWWIPRLKKITNYRHIPLKQLQNLKDTGKKLGSGTYAIIYSFRDYAIKVINHRFYKHLPRIDGALEARILSILQTKITYSYISPNIIISYQYTPDKKTDYIILEKLHETFWDYLQHNPTERIVKGIIVQVLFTLLVIQDVFPEFRHNDLKIDNILLDFTLRRQKLTLHYKNYYWIIPVDIPLVKIADFDYACIPKMCVNPKVGTGHARSFGCTENRNHVYDLHLFLNSVYSHRHRLTPKIITWLQQQLPEKTRGNETIDIKFGRLKIPKKWENIFKHPLSMLIGRFFSEYQTTTPTFPLWGL